MSDDDLIDDTAYFKHKRAMEEHRARYPEQYAHPLVGAFVRTPDGTQGNVTRVVQSRHGNLAILDDNANRAWAVDDLVEIPRSSTHRPPATRAEALARAQAYVRDEMGWPDAEAVDAIADPAVDGVWLVLVRHSEGEIALLLSDEVTDELDADDFYHNKRRQV